MAVALFTSCGKNPFRWRGRSDRGTIGGFNEPAPYGMVLIKRGSFEMGPADKDSLWGSILKRKASLSMLSGWTRQR